MRYFDYDQQEENQSTKVPYDAEPIKRSRNYRPAATKPAGSNKLVVLLLAILLGFNIVLGYIVFRANANNPGRVVVENYYDIYNDSVNSSYMVSKALPSTVCIASGYNDSVNSSNISFSNFQQMSSKGSGVITSIDKQTGEATIITCEHVVGGNNSSIYILLFDSYKPIKATYVGGVREKDIAVLKITNSDEIKKSAAVAADVADSMYVSMGQMVLAIGNPMSGGFDSCMGYVRKSQTLVTVTNVGVERVIATSAPINSGNSGGGLFNSKGELIGIVNAKIESDSIDCVSFAIPSNLALSIAGSIERNNGRALKASLGLEFYTSDEGRETQNLDGTILVDTVVVKNVVNGGAADKAGIIDGDVVVGFTYHDDIAVDMISMYSFEDHAYNISVGEKVTFTILRGQSTIKRTVTITAAN